MNTTRRRAVLAGGDARLIAVLAQFDALEHRINALYAGPNAIVDDRAREPFIAPLAAQQRALMRPICELRAKTNAGFMARASSLALWADYLAPQAEGDGGWEERMIGALIRDMRASMAA